MRRIAWLSLPAVLVVSTAGAALDLEFAHADSNRDGYVNAEELLATDMFGLRDTDGNGVLSPEELGHERFFADWDENGDRDLSPAEFYDGILAYSDINRDGRLGSLEFQRSLVEWSGEEPVERLE